MGDNPTARLFAELLQALHDESDALVADDAARLLDAGNRREHLLRLLAPQANALRAVRRSGSDDYERLANEAAQLALFDGGRAMDELRSSSSASVAHRIAALHRAERD